jgi:5-methylcytosine-specific restriction enzyme A
MPRPLTVCSTRDCPTLTAGGRCPDCKAKADRLRGTAAQRGYGHRHRRRFRPAVLRRDPTCRHPDGCTEPSTDADHWPRSRRDLVAAGLDPDDPAYGRGLCARHHKQETAEHQPGGWNAH